MTGEFLSNRGGFWDIRPHFFRETNLKIARLIRYLSFDTFLLVLSCIVARFYGLS
jgi:hypothetical protein